MDEKREESGMDKPLLREIIRIIPLLFLILIKIKYFVVGYIWNNDIVDFRNK